MRREERVTVQGPVKEQQPDGMSHRGGRSRCGDDPLPPLPSRSFLRGSAPADADVGRRQRWHWDLVGVAMGHF